MILAAGRGSRLKELTNYNPKPMLLINGKPLIQYHVERLVAAGIVNIVVNTCWLAEKIEGFLQDGSQFQASITFSRELEMLETAGGIIKALPLIKSDPFLVINADIYTDFDFANLQIMRASSLAKLFLVANPKHNLEGDFAIDDDFLAAKNHQNYTFSGIGLYRHSFFDNYPHNQPLALSVLFKNLLNLQKIEACVIKDAWFDIGTRSRMQELERFLGAT